MKRGGVGLLIVLAIGLAARPAAADLLDDVLRALSTAGVVKPVVVEARPMIQCLVDGDTVERCAQHAAGEARGLLPSDPQIQKVVAVYTAARSKDWLKVFLLAGEQVVCGLTPGGAVADLFCTQLFTVARPVIAGAYDAVKHGDIVKLIALVGVEYACDLLPSAPGASELCGVLGDIAKGVGDGVKAAIAAVTALGEAVSGQTEHMPVDAYYVNYWRVKLHHGVLLRVAFGKNVGLTWKYQTCVSSFDAHRMSRSNAEQVCGIMRDRLQREIAEATRIVGAFPDAYFAGALAAKVPSWAGEHHGTLDVAGEPFASAYAGCSSQLRRTIALGPAPGDLPVDGVKGLDPPTAYAWACREVGKRLLAALQQERARLDAQIPKVLAAGCTRSQGWFHFWCPTYAAYRTCSTLLPSEASPGQRPCWLKQPAADQALAREVAGQLGPKRCAVGASGLDVTCTRPWKRDACRGLVARLSAGSPLSPLVSCALRDDSAFRAGVAKAESILGALNTVTRVPVIDPGTGKTAQTTVALTPGCRVTWDPLRITCTDPAAVKELATRLPGVALPFCAPDPNQDGADVPCYGGPLSVSSPAPAVRAPAVGARPAAPATRQGWARVPPTMAPTGRPDIAPDAHLVIGRTPTRSGASVTVDARDAASAADGVCQVPIRYTGRNLGTASTGPFASVWRNSSVPGQWSRTWASIDPGASDTHTDLLALRPGPNVLRLTLDHLGQVHDENKANNQLQVTVHLTGPCGPAGTAVVPPAAVAPPAPGRLSVPGNLGPAGRP